MPHQLLVCRPDEIGSATSGPKDVTFKCPRPEATATGRRITRVQAVFIQPYAQGSQPDTFSTRVRQVGWFDNGQESYFYADAVVTRDNADPNHPGWELPVKAWVLWVFEETD